MQNGASYAIYARLYAYKTRGPSGPEALIRIWFKAYILRYLLKAGQFLSDNCGGYFGPRAIILTNLVEIR